MCRSPCDRSCCRRRAARDYGGRLLDGGLPLADPEPPVTKGAAIAKNAGFLLAFFGADDFVMSLDEWHRIGDAFRSAGVVHEQVTYDGVGHGFFNDERPETYVAEAAGDAWQRTLAALATHVRDSGSAGRVSRSA